MLEEWLKYVIGAGFGLAIGLPLGILFWFKVTTLMRHHQAQRTAEVVHAYQARLVQVADERDTWKQLFEKEHQEKIDARREQQPGDPLFVERRQSEKRLDREPVSAPLQFWTTADVDRAIEAKS